MPDAASARQRTLDNEKIVDFSAERLCAPFPLRCAALFFDYIILLALPVAWLFLARFFSDTGAPDSIGSTVWILGALLFLADFLLLPMINGQSIGKMLAGINIVRADGTRISPGIIIRRNILGYLITMLTLGLGFLFSALSPTGRALHDHIAGTVVVRGRKTQVFN